MCFSPPKVTPAPNIVERSDAAVQQAQQRRLTLGQQTGGKLATRFALGGNTAPENRFKLG